MSMTIKIKCAVCGETVEYDGKITCCPHCMLDFESDEITEWKKRLSLQADAQTTQLRVEASPQGCTKNDGRSGLQKMPKMGVMPKGVIMPKAQSVSVSSSSQPESAELQEKRSESNGAVYEWRGVRYYSGQEKDALLFILRNVLIDEIVDENNVVTDKARKLLGAIGKNVPSMVMYSRERKFFEIMYGTVFPEGQLPLYINDARTGLPMANDREQFIERLERNAYVDAVFEFNGKRIDFKELVYSGVIGAYLQISDGINGLRKLFGAEGKRLSIDENCNCVDLGGDDDICRRDNLMLARYEYYLVSDLKPCDAYDDNAKFDSEFLSLYGGYAYGENTEKYMSAYFYLLSVALERRGVCEVFGVSYTVKSFLSALKSSAEKAAENNVRNEFVLMLQLLKHKVFGGYNSDYERITAGQPNVESALFEAYYGLPKDKKLLYYDGKYLSAQSIARKIGERGSVGDLLNDNGGVSFMSSVGRCVKVDVARIKSQIDSGIKNILEGLR